MIMNQGIKHTIELIKEIPIEDHRKANLDKLSSFILSKHDRNLIVKLNFICTHNSRRSHLAQIWATVAADYYGINKILCFSGGTEATAMFPMIKNTLIDQGFDILKLSDTKNPTYAVKYSDDALPIICFSKVFENAFNPSLDFVAVMTCDHADQNCPLIPNAETRFAITYEDPKKSDGTSLQKEVYAERSLQIASEMFYVFGSLNS